MNDALMRFFDHCDKFVALVEDNDTAMYQVNAFKEGPEMRKVLEKVASALCLPAGELNAGMGAASGALCSVCSYAEFLFKMQAKPDAAMQLSVCNSVCLLANRKKMPLEVSFLEMSGR